VTCSCLLEEAPFHICSQHFCDISSITSALLQACLAWTQPSATQSLLLFEPHILDFPNPETPTQHHVSDAISVFAREVKN
jgi:hypothetical protein